MITGQLDFTPKCPNCDKTIGGFTGEGDRPPEFGDITICIYCFSTLIVDHAELRMFRDDDFESLAPGLLNEVSKTIKICRLVMERKK